MGSRLDTMANPAHLRDLGRSDRTFWVREVWMSRWLVYAVVFLMPACGDDKGLPVGGTCGSNDECAAGLCLDSLCVDPAGDEDGDSLINGLEAALGTNFENADSDADGKADAVEVGDPKSPTDSDDDGLFDAIDSAILDADGDCIMDELDPANSDPLVPGSECSLDCNGVVEAGEACDDGDVDPSDGCDQCTVVPLPVSRVGRDPLQGEIVGLTNGGFLATWHEGRSATEGYPGHSVAFYDSQGIEVRRHEDIRPPLGSSFFKKSVAALRGGDAVVGSWFITADGKLLFEVRRYTDVGEPEGEVLEALNLASNPGQAELVAVDPGAYAFAYVDQQQQLIIHYVDAAGNLSPLTRGRALRGTERAFDIAGFRDGSVVVVSPEPDTNGTVVLMAKRFGSEGPQVGEDVPVLPAGVTALSYDVVLTADGYSVFFSTGGRAAKVGYQRLAADDTRVGDVVYLFEGGPDESCLREVQGAFNVGGAAIAAVHNGCDEVLSAWLANDDGVMALSPATQTSRLYAVRTASFAGGLLFQYSHAPEEGVGAVYLTRFTSQGERALLTR